MNERELIALEDLCDTLHKEVADLEKERRELKEKVAEREGRIILWRCWPPPSIGIAQAW